MSDVSPSVALHAPWCSTCNRSAELFTGREVYPHRRDLYGRKVWVCKPCGSMVGCHTGSIKPLGTLANAELRKKRTATHKALDPFWQSGLMSRDAVYAWVASALGLSREDAHVGRFTLEQCDRLQRLLADQRRAVAGLFTTERVEPLKDDA